MGQEMELPIEYFRTQKTTKTDPTMDTDINAITGMSESASQHTSLARRSSEASTEDIIVDVVKIRENMLSQSTFIGRNKREEASDLADITDQWTAIAKFIEVAEREDKKLAEKGIVRGPIDHDDLWKEWEG